MTSRERVEMSLSHQEPDRIPLDLGGSSVTGMHVSTVYQLRQALGLDKPRTPVKVIAPYQMLGEIGPDLMERLGVDVVGLRTSGNTFGLANTGWKEWQTFDGTPVLVPQHFNTQLEPDGSLLQYPQGDKSAPPSGHMPKGGWYFDAIIRQEPFDEDNLQIEDNLEEYQPIAEQELEQLAAKARELAATGRAVFASFGGTSFGDIAHVPALHIKHPKGIRDIEEWYVSTMVRPDHIYRIFEKQCDIALSNLERIHQAVGEDVSIVSISGTDFGMQTGLFTSVEMYRQLYQPFHRRVNAWVHEHTTWKTFIHSCGSVFPLIEHFIDAGFDILNPVQCSAENMNPKELKDTYGSQITFWGGGVDTQTTLPFGTVEDVRREVKERIQVFGPGGGFVFNPVHNVQAGVPPANLVALYETLHEQGAYPV